MTTKIIALDKDDLKNLKAYASLIKDFAQNTETLVDNQDWNRVRGNLTNLKSLEAKLTNLTDHLLDRAEHNHKVQEELEAA